VLPVVKSGKIIVGDRGKKKNLRKRENIHCYSRNGYRNGQTVRDDECKIFVAIT
jgi:hypothetical protein